EQAWMRGPQPDLDAFLAGRAETHTAPLLADLVGVDLEYRLRGGQAARVEDYLERFPALAASAAALLDLVALEYRVRRLGPDAVTVDEYLARFPALREEVAA